MSTSDRLSAEIITTGTEILLGEIVDTNAAWIAQQLRDYGINLYYKTTVGDNEGRLREVLETAIARSDIIIVTGGLGPTADDITRDAIAKAVGQPLILHPPSLEAIRARFVQLGAVMTPNNERQAYMPAGATVIDNPVGTAPAFRVEKGRATIIALPGVPREMKHLMTTAVLPYLHERNGAAGVIRRRVLRTVGIGESAIDNELEDLMAGSNPTVGLAAHFGQVDVRITASAPTIAEADALLDPLEAAVRARVGRHIYSTTPNEPFPRFVVDLLTEQGAQVALLETVTEGRVTGALRTAQPGTDPVAALWTESDLDELGLAHPLEGALTEELAQEIAVQIRARGRADYGLVLLGRDDAAAGTVLALAGPGQAVARHLPFGGREPFNQRRAGNQALILLWRALTEAET